MLDVIGLLPSRLPRQQVGYYTGLSSLFGHMRQSPSYIHTEMIKLICEIMNSAKRRWLHLLQSHDSLLFCYNLANRLSSGFGRLRFEDVVRAPVKAPGILHHILTFCRHCDI